MATRSAKTVPWSKSSSTISSEARPSKENYRPSTTISPTRTSPKRTSNERCPSANLQPRRRKMAGNTLPRRVAKRLLAPLLNESTYAALQAVAMSWDIRRKAWWEPELELLPKLVERGDTVLDIGANFGLYAYYLSRAVGPSGRVYCFEPIPFTARTFGYV